jgi:hypothetical protein
MTIDDIEDHIIATVEGLSLFRQVLSAGRKAIPTVLSYPAALVCFTGDVNTGMGSRLVMQETFQVVVVHKNLVSEKKAARSAYDLLVAVRTSLHGENWDHDDLDQMNFEKTDLISYESGEIAYAMTFSVTHKYGVVTWKQ